MQPTPRFDELHVISDLHLGGISGQQIFDQGLTVAAFIRQLAAKPTERKIGLVINGDFVDFLAEPAATWFDPEGAVPRLERIAADPAFSLVFEALREFVKTVGRRLIITLGTHDVELALPWVRERLLELLSEGDEAACGRIALAFDGAGFRCAVGSAPVLCVHGNEVDQWNVTDHDQIRRVGRDLVQGRTLESWRPNAGTRMVVEVINEIKREYPFVDLLKPEFQAALPILLAIKPTLAEKIADIGKVALRLKWDGLNTRFKLLSTEHVERGELAIVPAGRLLAAASATAGEQRAGEPWPEEVLRRLLGAAMPGVSGSTGQTGGAAELLARAEQYIEEKRVPLDLIGASSKESQLELMGTAWKRLTGRDEYEVLHAALENVQKDRNFELGASDDAFRRLDALVGSSLCYVISGHTHLCRALPRTWGGGFYYNTGTWARLMLLPKKQLGQEIDYRELFARLKVPTLAELDQSQYVHRKPTAACIEVNGLATHGSLREFRREPDGTLNVTTLEGSVFPPP